MKMEMTTQMSLLMTMDSKWTKDLQSHDNAFSNSLEVRDSYVETPEHIELDDSIPNNVPLTEIYK